MVEATRAGLPDVNALTHPFARVQGWLDRAAWLELHAEPARRPAPAYGAGKVFDLDGGFVLRPEGTLRPLAARLRAARVTQSVGQAVGRFRCRWEFADGDPQWSPGKEPKPALFDPGRGQGFVVSDAEVELGSSGDRCHAYGLGRTYPVIAAGRPELLVGAIADVVGGEGVLEGVTGTLAFNGRVTARLGFEGSVTLRVLDPDGRLHGGRVPPPSEAREVGDGATYLVLRGQKKSPDVPSLYAWSAGDATPIGLDTPAEVFTAEYRVAVGGGGGLRTRLEIGEPVGSLEATILFDLDDPPGTAARPNPFSTRNSYRFVDDRGRVIAGIRADVRLGRTFDLRFPEAPDQGGLRYAGVGPIVGSSGALSEAQGMVAVNSAVALAPHALSMLNVLRIVDPDGRFRDRLTDGARGGSRS